MSAYDGEPDVSEEVASAFAKFQQGAVRDHRVRFREFSDMNHVESQILDLVARLFPAPFARLAEYRSRHDGFVDPTVARCEREVQFYLAYLEHIAPLKAAGLSFSYPRVSARSKEIAATATFDLALAAKLVAKNAPVVCNDFHLSGPERVLVVSGPNNGGKTTFARTFGQLHYLAGLGLPVPGTRHPPLPPRPHLQPLRAQGGHRDPPGQVRGRAGPYSRDPRAGDAATACWS